MTTHFTVEGWQLELCLSPPVGEWQVPLGLAPEPNLKVCAIVLHGLKDKEDRR